MVVALCVAFLIIGGILGAAIALLSVNQAFASAKVHLCSAKEVNYAEAMQQIDTLKQQCPTVKLPAINWSVNNETRLS